MKSHTNSIRITPPTFNPVVDSCVWYSCDFGPLGNTSRFTVNGKDFIPSGITRLFGFCCPPAITGFITTVVVNSINRVLGAWGEPNGINKSLEVINPTGEHRDPSATIVLKALARFVKTPFFNALPYDVFPRPGKTMGNGGGSGSIVPEASTRNRPTVNNVLVPKVFNNPAVALAEPAMVPITALTDVLENKKPSKPLPNKISYGPHCFLHSISINRCSTISRVQ